MATDLLTLTELAALLKRPKNTLLNDRTRNPNALPQAITLPGTRHILFRRQDVDAWLAALAGGAGRETLPQPPERRRGRPRKSV